MQDRNRRKTGREMIRIITGQDPDRFLLDAVGSGQSARAISAMLNGQVSHVTIARYLHELGYKRASWAKPAA
jgi:predicted AAA+ superfamily ATPase